MGLIGIGLCFVSLAGERGR